MTRSGKIHAVDHVHVEATPDCRADLRWFYGELIDLEERADAASEDGVLRFRSARIELRVALRDNPKVEATACRAVFQVSAVDAAVERLTERRMEFMRITAIGGGVRLSLLDPGGNRVELFEVRPL